MAVGQDIDAIVSATVAERLAGTEIDCVVVRPDTDSGGDPILRIIIVLGGDESLLDPTKMLALVGHLRDALEPAGVTSFPLLSFVSRRDAKAKLRYEAA